MAFHATMQSRAAAQKIERASVFFIKGPVKVYLSLAGISADEVAGGQAFFTIIFIIFLDRLG